MQYKEQLQLEIYFCATPYIFAGLSDYKMSFDVIGMFSSDMRA